MVGAVLFACGRFSKDPVIAEEDKMESERALAGEHIPAAGVVA
jgi:hypothetical protein